MISLYISQNQYARPSFLKKEKKEASVVKSPDMQDHFYKQANKSVEIETVKQKYAKKTEILPLIMDRVMGSVGKYLEGEKSSKEFSRTFLDGAASLVNRITIDKDSTEYCKNYKPEISMIKNLTSACNEYLNDAIKPEQLDFTVEEEVIKYLNDSTVRKKNFPY